MMTIMIIIAIKLIIIIIIVIIKSNNNNNSNNSDDIVNDDYNNDDDENDDNTNDDGNNDDDNNDKSCEILMLCVCLVLNRKRESLNVGSWTAFMSPTDLPLLPPSLHHPLMHPQLMHPLLLLNPLPSSLRQGSVSVLAVNPRNRPKGRRNG